MNSSLTDTPGAWADQQLGNCPFFSPQRVANLVDDIIKLNRKSSTRGRGGRGSARGGTRGTRGGANARGAKRGKGRGNYAGATRGGTARGVSTSVTRGKHHSHQLEMLIVINSFRSVEVG